MRILMLPLVLALSACSLTPPLVKPQAPVPTVFPDAAAPGLPPAMLPTSAGAPCSAIPDCNT